MWIARKKNLRALLWIFPIAVAFGASQIHLCIAQVVDAVHNKALPTDATVAVNAKDRDGENVATGSSSVISAGVAKESTEHSVKLTWNPSVPVSTSTRDAIVGYFVYRSKKPHDRNAKQINRSLIAGTTFVDVHVEPGKVYYYTTRAKSAGGMLSGPSNEAQAAIPRKVSSHID